jgi:hypothetical protein
MKQAIHLLDPVKGTADKQFQFITARCGRFMPARKIEVTTNPAEVTCEKCKSYIDSPYRVLRKYGHVAVVDDMFVMLWCQYGYKFDMCAVIEAPGTWTISVAHQRKWHVHLTTTAENMTKLGFKLVDIIEKEIMNLKNQTKHGKNYD